MEIAAYLHRLYHSPAPGLPPHLSFHDYMDVCLFHPRVGYYSSGKVDFGMFRDYWTYPTRLSPAFGELLADRVLEVWRLLRDRVEAADVPFHVVEIGGGEGQLLRDLLEAVRRRGAEGDSGTAALAQRINAISVDRSPALLETQAEGQHGLAVRYIEASADQLGSVLETPFYGLIFANELLDQLSAEIVHISAERAARLRVLPWLREPLGHLTDGSPLSDVGGDFRPLRQGALPDLIEALDGDDKTIGQLASGEIVCWTGILQDLHPSEDDVITRYLAAARPAIERLAKVGGLPAWVHFTPAAEGVLDEVASVLLTGGGAFVTIDYGGTGYHIFDGASRFPHVRTYCRKLDGDADDQRQDEYTDKQHNPFRAPGYEDITSDIDFTWTAGRLEGRGLEVVFYGHQGALEGRRDLWRPPLKTQLERGRVREGYSGVEAVVRAHDLVKRFRSGAGFRMLVSTSPGLEAAFTDLGESDPLRFDELTERIDCNRDGLIEELLAAGVGPEHAPEIADQCISSLHPTGSIVDDLGDQNLYRWRRQVLAALR
jgi:SAM-dependent MidA family methyltransferase